MHRRRIERLNEQIKRELMDLVRRELADPRVANVTLTAVETTPDLYHARVYVTLLGGEDERAAALAGLRAARPLLRGELGRRLHIRRVPELEFTWDETLEQARRIESLLAQVRPPDEAAADEPDDD
jgi:ribosome-binding factor A